MANFSYERAAMDDRQSGSGWGWVFAYGVLLILGGILAFLNPMAAGFAAGVIFGVSLIAYGVFALIAAFSGSVRSKILEALLGVIAILAGVFALFDPFQGAASFAWAIGVWLLMSGVLQIVYAIQGDADRGWRLALGVIDVLLGGFLAFSGPLVGVAFIAAIVGFSFLLRGIFLVILANGLRKFARR